jgi:Flp pilus assembly protein TadD
MYRTQARLVKFNSVCGLLSSRCLLIFPKLLKPSVVLTALFVVFLFAGSTMARAVVSQSASAHAKHACPARQDEEATLGEASSLLQQSQYQQAAATLTPLADLQCEPVASLLLAAADESQGNVAEGEKVLSRAHATWPANSSIAASLAREYMSSSDVAKAVQALDHFHAVDTTPQQEMEAAAVAWIAGHQLQSALTVAQLNYRVHSSDHSLLLLANVLQLQGRYKDVIALLQGKRTQYARSAPFLVTLAESEYDANIFDAARSDLEKAVQLDSSLYQAHYLLGNVLMKQGDMNGASAEYRQAITLAPDQPRTYYQLALVLRAQQHDADEEAVLAKAIEIDGHYALAHAEMGRILLNQNRLQDAVVQLNLAADDNPTLEQPYNLLARAYDRLGDTEKAAAMAKRLIAVRAANHKGSKPAGMGRASEDAQEPQPR